MNQKPNLWYAWFNLIRLLDAVRARIGAPELQRSEMKYFGVRIDSRDGSFIVTDRSGNTISNARLEEIFPELRDPADTDLMPEAEMKKYN